jgi:F-type H+-transporting ATPase subunit epsilon
METMAMTLKIMLPFKVYTETKNVTRIVAETNNGFYGFLPQRLDCIAALVPGIFTYETEASGTHYVAVDEGILIKTGGQILVSVRNAIGGTDLGKLHESVEKEFVNLDEDEKNTRSAMAKLESGFISSLEKFHND